MIRFVDIRNQGIGARFAFFDTTVDEFLDIGFSQTWDTWEEFIEDAPSDLIERVRPLCPSWVFDKGTDDIESWYTTGDAET